MPTRPVQSIVLVAAAWLLAPIYSQAAAAPTAAETAAARRWAQTHFRRVDNSTGEAVPRPAASSDQPSIAVTGGLLVLANHDGVLVNGRPDGRPLKIGQKEFTRGLLCHAPSKVVVQLPGPGKTLSSIIGVDANAGGGSVIFSVKMADREVFRSALMRGGEPGSPISVDLAGAREFVIEAGDAGDGIACDHADWADAKAILADGREVWLADLPIIDPAAPKPLARIAPVAPYSFVYGGEHSDRLLGNWRFQETIEPLDARRTRRTQTYVDPDTMLTVRCVVVEYRDYPTVEWTVYFRNSGAQDTPIIERIEALDTEFPFAANSGILLHHNVGSPCTPRDFAPLETFLGRGAVKRISGARGRPSSEDWPYFNLEWGNQGVIVVVGWPGQWAATFSREQGGDLRVFAGQELTRLKLHPGEEVRTPLIVLQFWGEGDWIRAQNIWRRWMVAHNLPRPGGGLVPTQFGGCSGSNLPNAQEEIAQIDGTLAAGIQLDNWILDAGWYPCGTSWGNVGTWEPDATRFPHGLREVADHLHAAGNEFVVWFEPERVAAGAWLANNHPEWILGGAKGGLLNLGNPDAWKWVVERVDGLLVSQGIDAYRQDFNIDPLTYWRANDAEDRQGITENKHVIGYLALWDELLRRHPNLWIDSCASGGRRNDLETMRRAVPLLRSDWAVLDFSPTGATGQQGQTYGLSQWLPFHGTGAPLTDAYTMRSAFAAAYRVGWDARNVDAAGGKSRLELLRRTVREFRLVKEYLLADFYPLTPYSLADDAWMAWQFDRPETGEGVIQAFRRAGSAADSMRLKLRGLQAEATYTFTDLDVAVAAEIAGREALEDGFPLVIKERRGSAVIVYKKRS